MAKSVGIVLVSHSHQLAEGLRDLIAEVAGPDVRIALAGGRPDGGLGTSDELIRAAIAAADGGAGVVLLTDLGSAVLTAREVLGEQPRDDVVLVDAPFVEGAVSAAALAATGADLATVSDAAREARHVPKF